MNMILEELTQKGKLAKTASYTLGILSTEEKNQALSAMAAALRKNDSYLLEENEK